jgi:hypothetical membrane protein
LKKPGGEDKIRLSKSQDTRFFWAVIAGTILYVVLDAVAQLLPPHYSPIKDAESDLAVGPYGYVMAINFVNRGVLSLLFIYALLKVARAPGELSDAGAYGKVRRAASILGIWGVGALLLAIFPTDVPATPVSWHGAIHLVVAFLAFAGGAAGSVMFTNLFGQFRSMSGARTGPLVIAGLSVLFFILNLGLLTSSIGGLVERLLLGSVLLWIGLVSAMMIRRPRADTTATTGV